MHSQMYESQQIYNETFLLWHDMINLFNFGLKNISMKLLKSLQTKNSKIVE